MEYICWRFKDDWKFSTFLHVASLRSENSFSTPYNEDATNCSQIFKNIQKEWKAQVGNIREAAAAEAAEANKDDDGEVNKGDSKWDKSKPKQATHSSKKKD